MSQSDLDTAGLPRPAPAPPRPSPRFAGRLRALTPAQRFQLVSLLVLLGGMLSTSWWLGLKIEERVISNTVTVNSLYVESLITPALQDLSASSIMSARDMAALDQLLNKTALGEELAALILWGQGGQILYSSAPEQVGRVYPPDESLAAALAGQVRWELTGAHDDAHIPPQDKAGRLIALYSPVREVGTGRVIAVVEFYEPFDPISRDIAFVQEETWLIVGGVTVVMYLLLAGFIQQTSATIEAQVSQLTGLLELNAELYERMRRATHRAASAHEGVLRRISADLHDGIAQYLGAARLHLGHIARYVEQKPDPQIAPFVERAQSAVGRAIQEVRGLASGLGLPELEVMPLDAVIIRAVDSHERLTSSEVAVVVYDLPEQASPATKVTLYRIIQEGLSNAYRHGEGRGQRVEVSAEQGALAVLIADSGPGFEVSQARLGGEQLGIAGMRDRVESLGGTFTITSKPGQGTWVRAILPLAAETEHG